METGKLAGSERPENSTHARVAGASVLFVAAGPVSRILSAGLLRWDGHSSGPRITARL